MLKDLCLLNGTSGDESAVRDYIISKIKDNCEYKVDALGSIIAFKKGKKRTNKKVMICAHMDEVGFIITDITDDGYLKFAPVGGIDARIVADRKVTINNINGVIGLKPIHLLSSDEKEKAVSFKNLFIDIGAKDKSDAEKFVSLGDFAYFSSDYYEFGEGFIKAKALDDRIGCMLMIELINSTLEYDTYFCFNVQEEVGLRGSKCTSFDIQPDISVILESQLQLIYAALQAGIGFAFWVTVLLYPLWMAELFTIRLYINLHERQQMIIISLHRQKLQLPAEMMQVQFKQAVREAKLLQYRFQADIFTPHQAL